MMEGREDRELVAALAERARADRGEEHPSDDALLAYLREELAEDVEDRLQGHLVACAECADRLLDLEPLSRPTPLGEVADLEAEASWRELQAKLPAASEPAGEAPRVESAGPGPLRSRRWWPVAALLALALSVPFLWPGGGGGDLLEVTVSGERAGAAPAPLIEAARVRFLCEAEEGVSSYRVQVVGRTGGEVLERAAEPAGDGWQAVFRASELPAGTSAVRCLGDGATGERLLGERFVRRPLADAG